MKQDLTTGTWQDDTGCPISIILVSTSDAHLAVLIHECAPGCLALHAPPSCHQLFPQGHRLESQVASKVNVNNV